ncbi:MAG: YabP/YqfC family sporulation protein, partial [Clostridia bacterium]
MENTIVNKTHSFRYDNTKLYITGLQELGTYDDKEIVLKLNNNKLVIKGENLKIDDLNIKNGIISIIGVLHSFVYSKSINSKSM